MVGFEKLMQQDASPFKHAKDSPPSICPYCNDSILNGYLEWHWQHACVSYWQHRLSICLKCEGIEMIHIKEPLCHLQCPNCGYVSFVVVPLRMVILPDGIHYADRCIFD